MAINPPALVLCLASPHVEPCEGSHGLLTEQAHACHHSPLFACTGKTGLHSTRITCHHCSVPFPLHRLSPLLFGLA